MRNLSLIAPRSRNDETNLRSNRDGKMSGPSLVGTVLARRYKILEAVDVDSFKAHDLTLDQTVTVRRALLASQRAGETWRQKVQQLALMRDPNFLNILDVIVDKSGAFVITERSRGRSIADLLRESSRLDLEHVLRLMTALARALDLAADFGFCLHPISSRWLFTETRNPVSVDREQRSFSDWPFLFKLDVWELVRPRDNSWPIITSKAQRRGSRALAVRQAALFTYELLCGEKKRKGAVKGWFKPVKGLGNAGNSILYRGLQGSSLFESSECFFHKLKAAIQSREGELRTLPATALASTVYTVTLPVASETISRFNRDTRWLATGVLGVLVCAVLVLAVLVQERKPKADDLTVVDANSSDGFTVTGLNGKSSGDKTTSGQASSVDQASTEISPKEKSFPQMEAAVSTPTTFLGFAPEISHTKAGLNTFSWTPVVRQGSARVIGPRTRIVKNRSSFGFGTVDVKRRLIELWHESLARNAKSRSWTAFSNLNTGLSKKAAYTAETNH
jgi:hypothetical protein